MKTTHGSSFEYQSGLEWSVPQRWQSQLRADLDELQMYRAQQPDLNELEHLRAEVLRLTPNDAHARQCRTDAIEALVLRALDNATLIVDMLDVSRCRRTKKVREHLLEFKDRYKILKPPSHASVRKVLIKHNFV